MKRADYPNQEPLPAFAHDYDRRVWDGADAVTFEEIAYGDDPYQRIALVSASEPTGIVLAFIHGGGWTCGYKEWNLLMAPALVSQGVTFASIGYRLAPQVFFPENVMDCAAGIAKLWHELESRGIPSPKLFLGGHSAGGHLASLLTLDQRWASDYGLPISAVKGCLPVSGVYRFGDGSGLPLRPRFLGIDTGTTVERLASPLDQISQSPPPFFISWGTRDFPHLIHQGEQMVTALADAGGNVESIVFQDLDHFDAHLATAEVGGAWNEEAVNWMKSIR